MQIVKTKALTRKMFLGSLARALGSEAYTQQGDTTTLADDRKTLTITFKELPDFKLGTFGGVSIPQGHITLDFTGYSDEEATEAVQRFDRYYHRGGG